jgi:UDP-2,4-diacetamido-2,4,6-trideoxy-beta-L-altropyranose hydrolase
VKLLFRVDGGSALGTGHVIRCLAAAAAFAARGARSLFLCRDLDGLPVEAISAAGHALLLMPVDAADAATTLQALRDFRAELVVVDHYGLGATWERSVRTAARCVLAVDDLADRAHAVDLLLDQNFHADPAARYAGRVPPSTTLLLGPRFALVRREFAAARESMQSRSGELRELLVCFTGGDCGGETLKALRGIAAFGRVPAVHAVVGAANPHRTDVARACAEGGFHFHCQIDTMAERMTRADLAIGGGGSAHWERCALGLPSVVTVLADNQFAVTSALADSGALIMLGRSKALTSAAYTSALESLDAPLLRALARRAWPMVDGRGPDRVVDAVLHKLAAPGVPCT